MGLRGIHIKTCVVLALSLFMTGNAAASDFDDMVAAERAFAADASARSTREAFLAALANDGLVFQPGPTSGQRTWTDRAPDKNHLEWAPAMAEIAKSGDLGYTVGPWRFTEAGAEDEADQNAEGKAGEKTADKAADKAGDQTGAKAGEQPGEKTQEKTPTAFGWYFSIWRKQPDGSWRVLLDHGISAPAAAFPDEVQRRGGVSLGPPPSWPVGVPELRSADLAAPGKLTSRMVSADFLRLRAGQAPDGIADGQALASTATRLDTGLVVSSGGDLGVTWGGGVGSPAWIRVWRRPAAEDAPGQGWQLAVDFAVPAVAVAAAATDGTQP